MRNKAFSVADLVVKYSVYQVVLNFPVKHLNYSRDKNVVLLLIQKCCANNPTEMYRPAAVPAHSGGISEKQ